MNIHNYLNNHSGNTVVYCVGDKNIIPMMQNMITSHNQSTSETIVLFALDKEMADACREMCPVIDYYPASKISNMYFQKLLIAHEILKRNKIAIFIDADCIIQNSFKLDMMEQYCATDADCHVQTVSHKKWLGNGIEHNLVINCGTGIMSVRPTYRTKNLFSEEYLLLTDYDNYIDDQHYFNLHIRPNDILKINYLNKESYPNGWHYHANPEYADTFKIFHVSGIYGYQDMDSTKEYTGIPAKTENMKHLNYWYI